MFKGHSTNSPLRGDLDSEFSKRRTRYDVTLNRHEVADVLSAAMRIAKKRSQLLALVGLGLELLLRDRTVYADDAELLVALEAAADHHHAVHLIKALHSAADVSRVYVQTMEQARCTLKRMGIRLLDDKQPTDFEEADRNLMTLLRALRAAVREATKRRLHIGKLLHGTGVTTPKRINEANEALLRRVNGLRTVMQLPSRPAPYGDTRGESVPGSLLRFPTIRQKSSSVSSRNS